MDQKNQEQEEPRPDATAIRYAQEHRKFLEDNKPHVLADLQKSGNLESYLSSVGESASQRLEHEMSQHLQDKDLQKLPYHQKVRELQSRHRESEEAIRHDLIHQPTED